MGAGEREEPPRLVLPGPWGPVPASSTRKPLSPASCAHSPGQAPRPRGLALGGCLCSSTRPAFVYAGSLPPHSSGLAPQLPLQADSPKLRKVGTRNVLLAREWQRLAERQSRASFPNLSCLTLLPANSETQPGPKSLGVCAKPTVPLGPAQTSPSLRPSAPLPAPTAPGQPGLPAPSPWRGPMGGGRPGCCQEPRPLLRAAAFAKICSLALKSSCDSTAERLVTVSSSWGPVCPQPAYGAGFGGERGSCDIGGRRGQEPSVRGTIRLGSKWLRAPQGAVGRRVLTGVH